MKKLAIVYRPGGRLYGHMDWRMADSADRFEKVAWQRSSVRSLLALIAPDSQMKAEDRPLSRNTRNSRVASVAVAAE